MQGKAPLLRRRSTWAALAALALVAAGAGWYFFAPKPVQHVSDPAPEGGIALKRGAFQDGAPLHHASGTVQLLRVGEGLALRFEGYDATSGPDVYVYLTPSARASTEADVEGAGVKVRTPTMMGHATLRGDFNLDVPDGVDPAAYAGVAIWCETYDVLFGYAPLA